MSHFFCACFIICGVCELRAFNGAENFAEFFVFHRKKNNRIRVWNDMIVSKR